MSVSVIVGAQWGDEGKGKIVDLLSESMDIVARYQGGPNAGHTVVIEGSEVILHQIPSGILRPHTVCVIGNGVVIDPGVLLKEIDFVASKGVNVEGRLFISNRAHLIMPYHKLLDKARERSTEFTTIGTTGRGIGPAYVDKYDRCGIRVADLFNSEYLKSRLAENIAAKNNLFEHIYKTEKIHLDTVLNEYINLQESIRQYVTDTSLYLNKAIDAGKKILLEGAQGTLLDVDFGTYPYVTSSNPIASGAAIGLGIGPTKIDEVIGIVKAYTTRVGMGPLPTEFDPEFADRIRKLGGEFGATTGRPRRCGWFDAVVVRHAVMVNGITSLAITKLDVLDTLKEIKICVGYHYHGERLECFPPEPWKQDQIEPIYETHPGWMTSTKKAKAFDDLPANARSYLHRISELTGSEISLVSIGSERSQTIFVD